MKKTVRPKKAYIPGGFAYKHLQKIARLLGGHAATDFYGVIVGQNNVLYRHGLTWTQTNDSKSGILRYDQLTWHRPFGSAEDHAKIDFVLLHATKPRPLFFLFSVSHAKSLASEYPKKLNIACDPKSISDERQEIWDAEISLEELRRKLRS